MNNGKQGTIVKAYRLPDEDGKTTEEAPVYFTHVEEQPYCFFSKGPFFKVPLEEVLRRYTGDVHKSHSNRQQHAMVRRPRKMLCRYRPPQEVSAAGTLAPDFLALFRTPDMLGECSISNTHVLKPFSFDRVF